MINQRIKDFWVNKINTALTTYSVDPSTLDEGTDWIKNLNALSKWREIDRYGKAVFTDVFTKANQVAPDPLLPNSDNYGNLLGNAYVDLENEFADLVNVFKTKIGVNPESSATITQTNDDGTVVYIPKWKHDINRKITNSHSKLTDIPNGLDIVNLLYTYDLYKKIINNTNGLPDLISSNLTGADRPDAYGFYWKIKVNEAKLAEYKDLVDDLDIQKSFYDTLVQTLDYNPTVDDLDPTDLWKDLNNYLAGQSILELIQQRDRLVAEIVHAVHSAGGIPNNWHNDVHNFFRYCHDVLGINDINGLPNVPAGENLNTLLARVNHTCTAATPCSLAHCPNTHSNYDTTKGESNEYQRIHTKLKGKISDSELDTLLNPICSHTDYDTIKQERDRLKTGWANHECDSDGKVAAKETEIITKIIIDLGLTTERERENILEAVIAEIKTKITPPTDNSKEKELLEKQTKITELEAKIANLQSSQSLQDAPISNQVKDEIVKISQELNLTSAQQAKLEKVSSYQELNTLQREAFQERLNGEISSKKTANYLNWALGALTLSSLLVLAYVLRKRTNSALLGKKKKIKKLELELSILSRLLSRNEYAEF